MPIRLTRAVKALIIACFVAFVVQHTADQWFDGHLKSWFALTPAAFIFDHRYWQIFTYPFIHDDVVPLFLNLMMLAFIGGEIEATWGTARFLRYCLFCSLSAGVLYLMLQLFVYRGDGLHVAMFGASGAIYGLLMAYGLIFGERVLLFMMLFPMKAKYFVWILAAVELMSTVFSNHGGLAGASHLGGMIAGFGFLWGRATYAVLQRQRAEKSKLVQKAKKRRTQPNHLKLVINNKNKVEFETTSDEEDDEPPTFH